MSKINGTGGATGNGATSWDDVINNINGVQASINEHDAGVKQAFAATNRNIGALSKQTADGFQEVGKAIVTSTRTQVREHVKTRNEARQHAFNLGTLPGFAYIIGAVFGVIAGFFTKHFFEPAQRIVVDEVGNVLERTANTGLDWLVAIGIGLAVAIAIIALVPWRKFDNYDEVLEDDEPAATPVAVTPQPPAETPAAPVTPATPAAPAAPTPPPVDESEEPPAQPPAGEDDSEEENNERT